MMRSKLGGHVAGTGIKSWEEEEETYKNKKVHVRLTHDYESMEKEEFEELCRKLSGDVTVYNTKRGEKDD